MDYRAITLDTGGAVLDWHAGLFDEVHHVPVWQGLAFDRYEFVNTWRRNTMKAIVGQIRTHDHVCDHFDDLAAAVLPK